MKILILIGMIVIFISAFFIFFIFDTLIRPQVACFINSQQPACSSSAGPGALMIGLLMVIFFVVIDIVTVYIILTTMSESESAS
jgi:hypothetical protein